MSRRDSRDENFPPLVEAAIAGDETGVRELIDQGAKVDLDYEIGEDGVTLSQYLLYNYPDGSVEKSTAFSIFMTMQNAQEKQRSQDSFGSLANGEYVDLLKTTQRIYGEDPKTKLSQMIAQGIPMDEILAEADPEMLAEMVELGLDDKNSEFYKEMGEMQRDEAQKAMHEAYLEDDLELFNELVDGGADPSRPDPDNGRTTIEFIAAHGGIDFMESLVERGFDLDAQSKKDGMTPLMLAAEKGNIETVGFLVKNGSDLNKTDMYGFTAQGIVKEAIDEHDSIFEMAPDAQKKGEVYDQQRQDLLTIKDMVSGRERKENIPKAGTPSTSPIPTKSSDLQRNQEVSMDRDGGDQTHVEKAASSQSQGGGGASLFSG